MPGPNSQALRGLLNLDKPTGVTSRDVVNLISRPLRKVKVGHAGTLDPLASGVLVVCVGPSTRLIESVQAMPKSYRAIVRLGARSDTLDADGRVEEIPDAPIPAEAAVRVALAGQVGTIDQLPPQFSALKVGGRRAYDLARAGEAVDLAPRAVRVDRIDLIAYAWPRLEFTVNCGSGTYIRSIARDVGEALGSAALIEVLVRTAIGPFLQGDAFDPTGQPIEAILARLRPDVDALGPTPRLAITGDQVAAILQGRSLRAGEVEGAAGVSGEVALIGPDGTLVALATVDPAGAIRPGKVLATMPAGLP